MARSEARLSVDIWNDEDFRALPGSAQRVYFFLLSQPDIAHDGVIALRPRRWSQSAVDLTEARMLADLEVLARARFVVVDHEAEELLVRSFIRRDAVYRQPNLLRAARKHLALVTSRRIRAALEIELHRVRSLPDVPKGSPEVIDEMLAELHVEPFDDPSPNPSAKGSPKGSPDPSENGSPMGTAISREGIGVVTAVSSDSPIPLILSPEPLPLASLAGADRAALALVPDPPDTTQALVGEWLERCRKRPPPAVVGQIGKHVKAMLADGIAAADIRDALEHWRAKGLHPSALPSVVNELMNASPVQARASPDRRSSTTDQRVADGLALAERLAREETPG